MKVLMIEDDGNIVEIVSLAFRMRLPEATLISTSLGRRGLEMVRIEAPDIVLLDLGLPDVSGFDVLERIRSLSLVPVLILTVRGEEGDIARGIELGADDYLVKPFRQLELLARIRTVSRRRKTEPEEPPLVCGSLRLDAGAHRLTHKGRQTAITATEAEILSELMKNHGRAVPGSALIQIVWGQDFQGATDSLKVHVGRLRNRIEEDPNLPRIILTEPGIGYVLVEP